MMAPPKEFGRHTKAGETIENYGSIVMIEVIRETAPSSAAAQGFQLSS
jgi:hypothetical protein